MQQNEAMKKPWSKHTTKLTNGTLRKQQKTYKIQNTQGTHTHKYKQFKGGRDPMQVRRGPEPGLRES